MTNKPEKRRVLIASDIRKSGDRVRAEIASYASAFTCGFLLYTALASSSRGDRWVAAISGLLSMVNGMLCFYFQSKLGWWNE